MPDAPTPDEARDVLATWLLPNEQNAFHSDTYLQRLLARLMGALAEEDRARLEEVGRAVGQDLDELVRESNRDENLPVVRRHDPLGHRVEEVVFHPSYHQVGRTFWSSGVLAALAHPGRERLAGAIAYLLDQHGEAGHACPIACTAGAIKLLQKCGTDAQRRRYLARLLETDYDRRLHAAQFVTEVQGGSDVGSNACVAEPVAERPGWYRITGEKWFCSVADAGLFVVSARLPDAAAGTKGLGLFLVPRQLEGKPNRFQLRRLKYKLGTRSMPTGEIEFCGSLGEAIGDPSEGFRNLVGIVLDTSRVHNAVAACGILRRAFVDSRAYAERRVAFGRAIVDYPAVCETLARMKLRTMAALATTFRVLDMTDRIDLGSAGAQVASARRIAVMINKYWTSIAATESARDGIEILGGNGTIEDFSVMPRLYRDAIVIESWEGTHNTLCAQVLRDVVARRLHEPWLAVIDTEVAQLDDEGHRHVATDLASNVRSQVEGLAGLGASMAAAQIRHVVDTMCRLTDWVCLCHQLQWEERRGVDGEGGLAVELYRLTRLERATPLTAPELVDLNRRLAS